MKKSVIAIVLAVSLLMSVSSCVSKPAETEPAETVPGVTDAPAETTETELPTETMPYYNISEMGIEEVEYVLLNAAGSGEPIIEYSYNIEENSEIGLLNGRTYAYHIMEENPDVFGGFNIFLFDPSSETFQNLQVGDFIQVSYMFNDELMTGEQAVTAVNGPYMFSAWETPRGGNYNNTAPFACEEIQAAYDMLTVMDSQ